jgi:leucyl-tRNA synthetase
MLSPFMPFLSNELHELLTGKSVDNANWPSPSPEFNAPLIELEEDLIRALLSDIHEVKNVINKDPSLISIYTPAPWKYQVLESLINSNLDLGTAMGILMQNEDLRAFGNEIKRFSTTLLTYLRQQSPERLSLLKLVNEFDLYSSAKDFFEKELGVKIELYSEDENSVDPSGKASQSLPFRPGIYME